MLDKGVEMLTELANGIISGIPQLLEQLPLIIESFVTFITDNLPVILDAGVKLLFNLANGIIAGIPDMVSQLPKIIKSITTTLSDNFPKIIRAGFDLLIKLADGVLSAIPDLVSVLPQVVAAILSGFSSAVSGVFEIGKNIVMGLWDGIKSMVPGSQRKLETSLVGSLMAQKTCSVSTLRPGCLRTSGKTWPWGWAMAGRIPSDVSGTASTAAWTSAQHRWISLPPGLGCPLPASSTAWRLGQTQGFPMV